jgi:beta-phosphoglucomutase-like phosphatase (HAD superfamily)
VAFEDAVNGILSAKAAGMRAVGVTTVATEDALRHAGADWIIRDFVTLPEELSALLFGPA